MPRKHVIVTGRVQGVGFRYTARHEAVRLGVNGYARNLPDGTVELEIEGDTGSLQRMLDWLETGPGGSIVAAVHARDIDEQGETAFRITG